MNAIVRWFNVTSRHTTAVAISATPHDGGTALPVDANGNPVQWRYDVAEMYKKNSGYGGFDERPIQEGFKTHTEQIGTGAPPEQTPILIVVNAGYNIYENQNHAGAGAQPSTGVDHSGADYPSSFDMTPLLIGSTYPAIVIPVANEYIGTDYEVWMFGVNGEDGTC